MFFNPIYWVTRLLWMTLIVFLIYGFFVEPAIRGTHHRIRDLYWWMYP